MRSSWRESSAVKKTVNAIGGAHAGAQEAGAKAGSGRDVIGQSAWRPGEAFGITGLLVCRKACCSFVQLEATRFSPGLIKQAVFVQEVRVIVSNLGQ